ncbi:MAG: hypothetical protein MI808_08200 [Pseudomonadales bacterium]|nr:hypothetical protein [Pseudomonadales bacterium]
MYIKKFREKYSFWIVIGFFIVVAVAAFTEHKLPLVVYAFLFGIDIIAVGVTSYKQAIDSKTWPIHPAKLIQAEAVCKRYSDNVFKWFLDVEYEYLINNCLYKGNNYSWVGFVSSSEHRVSHIAEELKTKSALYIHVSPNNPEVSVIAPGASIIHCLGIIAGLAICVVTIYFGHHYIFKW